MKLRQRIGHLRAWLPCLFRGHNWHTLPIDVIDKCGCVEHYRTSGMPVLGIEPLTAITTLVASFCNRCGFSPNQATIDAWFASDRITLRIGLPSDVILLPPPMKIGQGLAEDFLAKPYDPKAELTAKQKRAFLHLRKVLDRERRKRGNGDA